MWKWPSHKGASPEAVPNRKHILLQSFAHLTLPRKILDIPQSFYPKISFCHWSLCSSCSEVKALSFEQVALYGYHWFITVDPKCVQVGVDEYLGQGISTHLGFCDTFSLLPLYITDCSSSCIPPSSISCLQKWRSREI